MNETSTGNAHPVWAVYDKLRTARLSVKYYGHRLRSVERANFCIEIILLASAPTSAIAGLWFWKDPIGRVVWQIFGVAAALAAILKPLLGYSKKIKEFEGVLSGYRMLEFDLLETKILIEQRQKYDASLQSELKKVMQRERLLVGKTPEATESRALKLRCEAEVLAELPSNAFYIPEDE
jgi:hypothetical protein